MTTVVTLALDLSRPEGRSAMQAYVAALAAAAPNGFEVGRGRPADEPDAAALGRCAADLRAVLYRAFGLPPKASLSNPEMLP